MKILIVEDEVLLADSLKTLLEKKGFTVEVAYDGETGKDYAETGVYDLLILDVMMPKPSFRRYSHSDPCGQAQVSAGRAPSGDPLGTCPRQNRSTSRRP